MVIPHTFTHADMVKSNCNFDDFIFTPFDSDDDSFKIFDQRVYNVDYEYRSNFFERQHITRPEQLDDLDEILRLYEPCNPECARDNCKPIVKNKHTVWKRFLFLFRKSKKSK